MGVTLLNICFDWKIVGIGIGWLGIAVSLIIGFCFAPALAFFGPLWFVLMVFLVFVTNLTASISWLCGLHKRKAMFMMVSLVWWAVLLSIWIGFLFYLIVKAICDVSAGKSHRWTFDHMNLIHCITAACAAYYFFAVISYKGMKEDMKKSRSEIPHLDVYYMTPGENPENTKRLDLLPKVY